MMTFAYQSIFYLFFYKLYWWPELYILVYSVLHALFKTFSTFAEKFFVIIHQMGRTHHDTCRILTFASGVLERGGGGGGGDSTASGDLIFRQVPVYVRYTCIYQSMPIPRHVILFPGIAFRYGKGCLPLRKRVPSVTEKGDFRYTYTFVLIRKCHHFFRYFDKDIKYVFFSYETT